MCEHDLMTRREILTVVGATGFTLLGAQAGSAQEKSATAEKTKGCWVVMYEHDNYQRGMIRFGGPVSVRRMDDYKLDNGKDAGDEIDSLVTGPSAWLEVYEDENFDDTCRKFGPNSKIPRLDDHNIGDNIDSFRLYGQKPPGWPG